MKRSHSGITTDVSEGLQSGFFNIRAVTKDQMGSCTLEETTALMSSIQTSL